MTNIWRSGRTLVCAQGVVCTQHQHRHNTVFNLVNGVDVPETELKIECYQRANHETILRNQARQVGSTVLVYTRVCALCAPTGGGLSTADHTHGGSCAHSCPRSHQC